MTEDFTTITYADFTSSTGVWNIVDHVAQAAVYANGGTDTYRKLDFGDGSDGAVQSENGYYFDTDQKPNGYNFTSVNISGGTIYVTGKNKLIIRALGSVTISPDINVKGGSGQDGVANSSTYGLAGGGPVTCTYSGGTGGNASASAGSSAADAYAADGSTEAGTGGSGTTGAGAAGAASASATGPGGDFDAGGFVCGTAGAGGGGHSNGAALYATGASGGAGGGLLRIIALGSIYLGNTDASGGDGGIGVTDGSNCSGHAAGGSGGAVWLQTYHTLSAVTPTVAGGNGGTGGGCGLGAGASATGVYRGDSQAATSRPAWAAGAGNYNTLNAIPSQSYIIQSKPYDLGTINAKFETNPTVGINYNSGNVTVEWAGSATNLTYTPFTSEISSLSNRGFRYLKFRITIHTASAAGISPQVTSISVPFEDASEKDFSVRLTPWFGCFFLSKNNKTKNDHNDPSDGLADFLSFMSLIALLTALIRRYGVVRNTRRGSTTKLPA